MSLGLSYLPWLMLISFFLLLYSIKNFVIVDSSIKKALVKKDREFLSQIFSSTDWNWYQRSKALQAYASIECLPKDEVLISRQVWSDTSFRLAMLEGCQEHDFSVHEWIYPELLKDNYSYIKFISLERIQNEGRHKTFQEDLFRLVEDSSTMVQNKAKEMVDQLQQNKQGSRIP